MAVVQFNVYLTSIWGDMTKAVFSKKKKIGQTHTNMNPAHAAGRFELWLARDADWDMQWLL